MIGEGGLPAGGFAGGAAAAGGADLDVVEVLEVIEVVRGVVVTPSEGPGCETVVAPVVAPDPPVVAPDPPVVAPDPPVVAPDPPVVAPDPPVVAPDPPVVAPGPSVVEPAPVSSPGAAAWPVEAPDSGSAASGNTVLVGVEGSIASGTPDGSASIVRSAERGTTATAIPASRSAQVTAPSTATPHRGRDMAASSPSSPHRTLGRQRHGSHT
ncbi:hypothetical protein [Pseudonocardia yuanmonensis]|uniref:hypothetical protein n=1 Tax=Pseudonocardia yuanmonensis TaxID=1095914 RepID=UPI0031EBBA89